MADLLLEAEQVFLEQVRRNLLLASAGIFVPMSEEIFPILETSRLLLREWQAEDAPALFQLFGDEAVVRYTPIEPHADVAQSLRTIERFRKRFREHHEGIVWAIVRKDSAEVIGETGIHDMKPEHRRVGIGYSLSRRHWRNGFATEAVGCVLEYLFKDFPFFGINRVEATTDPVNEASIKVLRKLSFKQEGLLRHYEFEKGKFVDSLMFSLLRSDRI